MSTQTFPVIEDIDEASFLAAFGVNAIDKAEVVMAEMPRIECPVEHTFTPGIYIRMITMPRGSLISSKIHGVRHSFIITKGDVSVWSHGKVSRYKAPYMGITEPGTKRLLFCHTDVEWVTHHPNPDDTHDLDEIEKRIMVPHQNPYADIEYNLADGSIPKPALE